MVFYQTYVRAGGQIDWFTSLAKAKAFGAQHGGDYSVYRWETHQDLTAQELILTLLREGHWSKAAALVHDTRYKKAEAC